MSFPTGQATLLQIFAMEWNVASWTKNPNAATHVVICHIVTSNGILSVAMMLKMLVDIAKNIKVSRSNMHPAAIRTSLRMTMLPSVSLMSLDINSR